MLETFTVLTINNYQYFFVENLFHVPVSLPMQQLEVEIICWSAILDD